MKLSRQLVRQQSPTTTVNTHLSQLRPRPFQDAEQNARQLSLKASPLAVSSLNAATISRTSAPHPTTGSLLSEGTLQQLPLPFSFANIAVQSQAQLAIGQPGDTYEQEADQVAAQVVQQINESPAQLTESVQRENIRDQEGQPLQAQLTAQQQSEGNGFSSSQLEAVINGSRAQGQPLKDDVRAPMEHAFGVDFSSVRIHTSSQSDLLNRAIQARAFTTGEDIFFRQGEYQPGNQVGQTLLAHELTHVVQQNGEQLQRKQSHSNLSAASASHAIGQINHNSTLIQCGEAHVHQGIEESAVLGSDAESRDEMMEMYAGNWMRDFSQLNLPRAHQIAREMPKDAKDPTGEKIGSAGAEDIITAIIRALAYLHFGTDITDTLITSENIGVYTPEQHMDNPMGTTAADHLVRDSETGLLREGRQQVSSQTVSDDPERDEQLAGKAFPGLQVDNPSLYEVSDAGLGKHIYNAIEWTKEQLWQAVSAGETPTGRMHLGSALHAVEDYFAHSNFVEVALNSEIGRAVSDQENGDKASFSSQFLQQAQAEKAHGNHQPNGAYVDTLYDQQTPSGRMAVTTGTAGSEDLKVSIGQIILPKLPKFVEITDRKIDEAFNLVEASEDSSISWEDIQKQLQDPDQDTAEGAATLEVINALDKHIKVPVYNIWLTGYGIPWTDRFVPTGYETSESSSGLVAAIQHYIRLHQRIMQRIDEFKTGINILCPITLLIDLQEKIVAWFRDQINQLKEEIKRRKNEFILGLVADITGVDAKEAKKRGLNWLVHHAAHESLEHTRGNTSIAAQLDDIREQDSTTQWAAYGIENGQPQYAFPPSHSEISKDHAPHFEGSIFSGVMADLKANQPEYDVEEGSLFYRLHRQLAVEADKHIIGKTQQTWDEKSSASSENALGTHPTLNPEDINEQARNNRALETERANREGRISASYGFAGQHVEDLMALVDLFVSHPDDTSWWRPIVRSYVSANEQEVIKHIRQRNMTRDKRH